VALEGGSIGYALQRYLASPDPAPRSFTFDRLNFDTGSAEIRAQDRPTIDALRQILAAYPDARVRIVGYTDARGDAGANADLGARRARAVAQALTGEGVVDARIESATGGETNPADTNATAQGQFDNRRTELVVLAK
jgi:outer membrane protein OmpA-like peptidoglycan-associated protein